MGWRHLSATPHQWERTLEFGGSARGNAEVKVKHVSLFFLRDGEKA